jgi:alkyl sulfatase BDS1-like metallo-beta-lactamase superfamily hydrolase
LCATHGLFEVTEGVYQVRSLDISNMTIVEGDTGVIDPLISAETAAAAIALYRKNRGDRPVTGVIYTHSHIDHFGGVRGVLPEGAGEVPILAPEGFLEHAVSENVYAGGAMNRRATYMSGAFLDRSPTGQVSGGLGIATSEGSTGLIAPTLDITRTGQVETVDGVRIVFQITPGTEAPAEMNFLFPARRALCRAENATHNLHNLLTLRGAEVRDARSWSRYLNEAIELFAADTDVAFASHHRPTWGTEHVVRFLSPPPRNCRPAAWPTGSDRPGCTPTSTPPPQPSPAPIRKPIRTEPITSPLTVRNDLRQRGLARRLAADPW